MPRPCHKMHDDLQPLACRTCYLWMYDRKRNLKHGGDGNVQTPPGGQLLDGATWARMAGHDVTAPKYPEEVGLTIEQRIGHRLTCIHRGPDVRNPDTGRAVTRDCSLG